MLKKLILLALVGYGLFLFYQHFMADTMEPFFQKKSGNVDFIGTATADKQRDAIMDSYNQ
ncbi:MAG: hypothetical protein KC618_00670 [Candidatus Omnitrophica bacterium]|nr:hypothetical protein [Candidatus Omnitrophota bacterium]